MSTEPPDTSEAVASLLQFGGVEAPTTTAIAAIAFHRKALADAGWVEVPKVKVELKKGDRVRHPTWGEGVIPSGNRPVIHPECGTVYVEFYDGPGCHIALSLLTKVEPDES